MKQNSRRILYITVFFVLLLFLYLLLVLFATIPNAAILNQMWESASYISNENPYVFSDDGRFRNITDNLADQMWLNIGWHMGTGNPFLSALDTRYYDGQEYGPPIGLYLSVTRGYAANTDYTRYWHGTAGLMRFFHLFTDIHGIKWIGMCWLVFLVVKTLRVLVNRGCWDLGLCLLASLFGVQIWNLRLSVEYLPCFLICFGLCPAFLKWERKGNFYVNILAIVSGTLTAFFDFLTTETVSILIPLILVVFVRSRERRLESPWKLMRMLYQCGMCWAMAYAGTFVVKWSAVSLATGENHFLAAMSSAGERIGGVVSDSQLKKAPGMLRAIGANFSVLFEGTSRTEYRQVVVHLMVIVLLIVLVYRLYRVRQRLHPGTMFLLSLGSLVFVRYGILANHSYLHAFFTYRAMASTILGILSAMTLNLHPFEKRTGSWKNC